MYSKLTNWDVVFDVFKKRYPHIMEKMKDWYPSGRDEFVVILDDGTKLVYNYFRDRIRYTYVPDDNNTDFREEDWTKEFSMRLKYKLKDRKITSDRLSEMTGISKVSISKYLNGKAIPSVYKAKLIAKALNCPMYDLYEF